MLGTRYEEHTHFTENLPIKFVSDILITPTTRRDEANWHENLEMQVCVSGNGTVGGKAAKKGETFFVSASCEDFTLDGTMEALVCFF